MVKTHFGASVLDYIVTHGVLKLSSSEWALRFPAAVWGILSIFFLYLLIKCIHNDFHGIGTMLLYSTSVLHVQYSRELRFYSIFSFLSILSTFCLVNTARNHKKFSLWILYGGSVLAMVYSHYYGFIVLFWHLLGMIVFKQKEKFTKFFIIVIVITILYLPWIIFGPLNLSGIEGFAKPRIDLNPLETILNAIAGKPMVAKLFLATGILIPMVLIKTPELRYPRYAMFIFTLSTIMIVVANTLAGYFFAQRQILFLIPLALYSSVEGIIFLINKFSITLTYQYSKLLITIVLLFISISQVPSIVETIHDNKQDWKGVTAYLSEYSKDGDICYVNPTHWARCVYYYWKNQKKLIFLNSSTLHKIDLLPMDFPRPKRFFWIHFHPYSRKFIEFLPPFLFQNYQEFPGNIHLVEGIIPVKGKFDLLNYMRICQEISATKTWANPPNEKHVSKYEYTALQYIKQQLYLLNPK